MSGVQVDIPKWYAQARCAEVGGDVWFPETKGRLRMPAKPALEICLQCPVLELCREYATTEHINYGIWGATTPRQRADIRHQRGIAEREEFILDLGELVPVSPLELESFDVDWNEDV